MPNSIRPDVAIRLVSAKQFLVASAGQLTPNSDAVLVGKMILTAHDAAELAVAAIANHLGVELPDRTYLTGYPALIERQLSVQTFPGKEFLRQLDRVRTSFKHHGIRPNSADWFRVIEKTWDWVEQWCATYLGMSLEDIDLAQLIENSRVKDLYLAAKNEYEGNNFEAALENLAKGLYLTLDRFPGITFPVLGERNAEHALLLSAFGVRPSDFLRIQELLPSVAKTKEGVLVPKWNFRGTGNWANWTRDNVEFCLEALVDIAIKVQHAPRLPIVFEFSWVFDDVITATSDDIELWQIKWEGQWPMARQSGTTVVKRLKKGESLRCRLVEPAIEFPSFAALSGQQPIDTSGSVQVRSDEIDGNWAFVERSQVEISCAPKDSPWIRELCPHLFK
jgi:hypothetical protein